MDHLTEATEKRYIDLLERELVPALGCTEPIALAYASARVREVLGILPERFAVAVCGNILKNVKSVIVPNTNGLKGVRAAVLIGAIGGNAAKRMEVLEDVTDEQIALCASMMQHPEICTVSLLESEAKLHFRIEAFAGNERALVEVMHAHTNIVRIERNGRVLLQCPCEENYDAESFDYAAGMTLESILAFAETVPLERIRPMLNRQISCNMEIAAEGLRGDYGLCVGQTLLTSRGDAPEVRARALAAAASDARMSGCTLPVVINSGSGNQGITAINPVIAAAQVWDIDEAHTLRAVALSHLVSIYIKSNIGKTTPFCMCGIGSASGVAAAISYLRGATNTQVEAAIINLLSPMMGILCDGAKPGCAFKMCIATEMAFTAAETSLGKVSLGFYDGMADSTLAKTLEHIKEVVKNSSPALSESLVNVIIKKTEALGTLPVH